MGGEGPGSDDIVKKMAQLMMQGAVMLDKTCPADGLPLFKLKTGDVVCPVHGKVVIVASDEEARDVEVEEIIREVRYRAARNVMKGLEEDNVDTVSKWLGVLETAERILAIRRGSRQGQGSVRGEGRESK
ncbi:conserved hypothetical protein [Aeropyrum pernix K1]|uniref:UPF0148 protein APE_0207 n=1 Tax=Aeropyrum pernix (strain ATCC 700893 / DSM 11879 / JCM 9820 / NBRC 100138 / K1) TaxID=272557 RepID=Y207_AERPE|nr:Sjogren's syndrome/scleroderma autoantigen 1 family protein [Aeropyrum pernix]Q9YFP2.1 RecName: Full=UPF0148 protein APE_0207 [Aeropyrum pernix K1]BAA79119.1 conserved hypothetical protein [Aeropyrum pernix K1]